ncbi:MAG: hypothetical protein UD304_05070, partial [Slackia isoflavoniconvertens]|nr:hypothetical protein [Slackia isoflavoniconvertens]
FYERPAMVKKLLCVVFAFALASTCVFAAAGVSSESVGAPQHIDAASPCPATGCASGECHGYANVPGPDGVHEMVCPELTCALVECHAWETLVGGGYRSASDASLNLWVLGPVVFFGGLVLLLKRMG